MPKSINAEIDVGTSKVLDAYLNYYKPNPTEEEASSARVPMLDMVNKYLDKTDPITKLQSLYDDWFAESARYKVEEIPTPADSSFGPKEAAEEHTVYLTFPLTGETGQEKVALEQNFGRLTDNESSSNPGLPRTFSSMEVWRGIGGKQIFSAQFELDYASGDFKSFLFIGRNKEMLSITKDERPGSCWEIEYTNQLGRFSGTQNLPDQIKVPVETFLSAPEALESSQDPSSTQTTVTTPTILQDDKPATQPSNIAPTATDG